MISSPAAERSINGSSPVAARIATIGTIVIRAGLFLVLLLVGGLKFTAGTAHEIQLYVSHSPLFSWLDVLLSERRLSDVFGTCEIAAGILIATRPFAPSLSALGSLIATGLFLSTITFLFTTPGVLNAQIGFPALSDLGSFLIKDVTLLGASIYTLGEALQHATFMGRTLEPRR